MLTPNGLKPSNLCAKYVMKFFDRSDANTSSLTFNDTIKVMEEFNERYGRWQDRECREFKHNPVKMETPGTDRVLLNRLKDFLHAWPMAVR